MEGSCEHGNELLGSIKFWEILELLSDQRLFKKDPAPGTQFVYAVLVFVPWLALGGTTVLTLYRVFGKFVQLLRNLVMLSGRVSAPWC
jgi:hypothetical protein